MKNLKSFLFFVLAITVGIGTAVYRISDVEQSPAFFHNGSWTGTNHLPLGKDDLLTTQVTLYGLFALPSEEAIYLFARQDDKGEKFNSANNYMVTGNVHQLHAKYWSITAYGKDLYLVPNEIDRYSFNNSNIKTDSAGNFSVLLSSTKHSGNWLPLPESSRFNVVLRLYKGEKDFIGNLSNTPLPVVKRADL